MNHLTLQLDPIHLPPSMENEPIDNSKDFSTASTRTPSLNSTGAQNLTDKFEQARIAFFSTQVFHPQLETED